jgi:hypothetical protein
MLQFKKHTPTDQVYYYASDARTDSDLRKDTAQLWAELLKTVRSAREPGTWNRLIFECWCTDGFVAAYPQKRSESPYHKVPQIVVSLEFLNPTRELIEGTDDEEKIRNAIALAYIAVRGAIRKSYKKEPALGELKATLETTDFTVWTMQNDDTETLFKFDLIF